MAILLQNVVDCASNRPDCFDESLFVDSLMSLLPLDKGHASLLINMLASGQETVDGVIDKLVEGGFINDE